jgi:hypothetical protein
MSIIIALLLDDHQGNRDIVFASDGRMIEHGTTNIRGEDFDKVKKLGNKTCLGYSGDYAEFYIDVFDKLKRSMKIMSLKDILFVSRKLDKIIHERLSTRRYKKVEETFGPLKHHFVLGGFYNNTMRIITLNSTNEFQINNHDLPTNKNIAMEIIGADEKVHSLVLALCEEKLGQRQSLEQIIINLRLIITKASEQNHTINNHIFIRRFSKEFELEKYLGYQ